MFLIMGVNDFFYFYLFNFITDADVAIAAAGTSCRHQIYDGTSRKAQHPVSILKSCLRN